MYDLKSDKFVTLNTNGSYIALKRSGKVFK
jgi:hypothetical protein